ncbi:uncharacterized protein TRIVIDRAFT_216229 [Trichoderma virens Gv29-8]|uniref:Uncharacterized protein n=1 Tax=Hypocrea virens (strain Gv29-8 / FGSC 10586) TaxID=413071 RepID=G9MW14_HYPVG|nr:uncharacterized protein TRIVIDRAFT_216229 [Trichoderma virens Gv29-8]EHK21310.1 hypothetical protein TRIVIDRAFT_216229 [Trichoderma virens Gv29-8]
MSGTNIPIDKGWPDDCFHKTEAVNASPEVHNGGPAIAVLLKATLCECRDFCVNAEWQIQRGDGRYEPASCSLFSRHRIQMAVF